MTTTDSIVIRPYQAKDHQQVLEIFEKGIVSNASTAYRRALTSPVAVVPLVTASALAADVARRLTTKLSTVWAVGLGTLAMGIGYLYCAIRQGFIGYVQSSLKDDMNRIEEVYKYPGCFLVAVDTEDGDKIIGTIAGEAKDPDKGVYELRRMSVSAQRRRSGLGRRLVQQLESELKPSMMFLTCTTIQYAAHRLYERSGFSLRKIFPIDDWFFGKIVSIRKYQKDYV